MSLIETRSAKNTDEAELYLLEAMDELSSLKRKLSQAEWRFIVARDQFMEFRMKALKEKVAASPVPPFAVVNV